MQRSPNCLLIETVAYMIRLMPLRYQSDDIDVIVSCILYIDIIHFNKLSSSRVP